MKKFTWSKIEHGEKEKDYYYYAYYGKEELGFICYYPQWKTWVWEQGLDIIMSEKCIEEVLQKLRNLNQEGKK